MVKFLWAGKKMEIWSFIGLFCLKNPNFGRTESEIRDQILLKLSTALQHHDRKQLCQLFAQAIFLLEETNWWNLRFWPSLLLEKNLPFFGKLNWKPGARICWNFLQPFTVRTGNWCVHFLIKQFIFQPKSSNESWNFDLHACYYKF